MKANNNNSISGTNKFSEWIKSYKKNIKQHWQIYLLILPALIFVIIFSYVPMYGVQLAFKEFSAKKGILHSDWIGFDNFTRFFRSYNFSTLLTNTLGISVMDIVVGFPVPIIFALLVNEINHKFFKKSIQLITYAPHFISTVVIVGMLNIFFQQEVGLVNLLLEKVGIGQVPFMASNEWFKTMYIGSGIWQGMGWGSIIYIASLSGVDPELHEAARIDGASKLQRILHINIPWLIPTIVILLILRCGNIMNVGFEKVLLMQNSLNMGKGDVISTYVYRVGLQQSDFSFGTAVGLFNSVVNCVLLISVNKVAKKIGDTSLW